MKFRWTINDLKTMSDYKILRGLIVERQSTLNPYAPLYKRLAEIHDKINEKIINKKERKL